MNKLFQDDEVTGPMGELLTYTRPKEPTVQKDKQKSTSKADQSKDKAEDGEAEEDGHGKNTGSVVVFGASVRAFSRNDETGDFESVSQDTLGFAVVTKPQTHGYQAYVYDKRKVFLCTFEVDDKLEFSLGNKDWIVFIGSDWCFQFSSVDVVHQLFASLLIGKAQYLRKRAKFPSAKGSLCFVDLNRLQGDHVLRETGERAQVRVKVWPLPVFDHNFSMTTSKPVFQTTDEDMPVEIELNSELSTIVVGPFAFANIEEYLRDLAVGQERVFVTFTMNSLEWYIVRIKLVGILEKVDEQQEDDQEEEEEEEDTQMEPEIQPEDLIEPPKKLEEESREAKTNLANLDMEVLSQLSGKIDQLMSVLLPSPAPTPTTEDNQEGGDESEGSEVTNQERLDVVQTILKIVTENKSLRNEVVEMKQSKIDMQLKLDQLEAALENMTEELETMKSSSQASLSTQAAQQSQFHQEKAELLQRCAEASRLQLQAQDRVSQLLTQCSDLQTKLNDLQSSKPAKPTPALSDDQITLEDVQLSMSHVFESLQLDQEAPFDQEQVRQILRSCFKKSLKHLKTLIS